MIAKITQSFRAQWSRDFTREDALLCICILLPIGLAVIALGLS